MITIHVQWWHGGGQTYRARKMQKLTWKFDHPSDKRRACHGRLTIDLPFSDDVGLVSDMENKI